VCVCSLWYPACNANAPYCQVSSPPVQHFSTLSHKRQDFRKTLTQPVEVLLVPLQLVYETFFTVKRIQRDTVIHVHRSTCDVPLFLPDFNETGMFSTDFRIILEHQLQENPSSGTRVFHLDGHEANSRFSQYYASA
jgi:hypothetical protein